jgi:hypothetical protein
MGRQRLLYKILTLLYHLSARPLAVSVCSTSFATDLAGGAGLKVRITVKKTKQKTTNPNGPQEMS